MKTLLSILLVFAAAAVQALTPFTFHWYYSNGQPMTNTGYMTPYPPATQTTVLWGTNFVFGNATTPIILQPNALGFGTNFAEPNQYRVYVTNNTSPSAGFAFLVNITDTANTNDLATYAVSVPVVYTLSTSYAWVTNQLGFAPMTNSFAGATAALGFPPLASNNAAVVGAVGYAIAGTNYFYTTNALGYVPAPNTFGGLTNILGFWPATNTAAGIAAALTYTPAIYSFYGITNALGYAPLTNTIGALTNLLYANYISFPFSSVTNWLGYQPTTNTYGSITNLLGYAPQVATFAALTNTLGYWPLTNTPAGITNTLGYVPVQPTFAAVTAAFGTTFTGLAGVTNSGLPATLYITNGVIKNLTIP